MLYDDDGIPLIHKLLQDFEQGLYVFEMQAGGRLVQHIQGIAGGFAEQLGRQFHTLALAAGKGH